MSENFTKKLKKNDKLFGWEVLIQLYAIIMPKVEMNTTAPSQSCDVHFPLVCIRILFVV